MSGRAVHGSLTADERTHLAQLGIDIVDLSANINPYGPHPRVRQAARRAAFDRYPDVDARSLRVAYASEHRLSESQVLAGNGSSELIYLAARAFLRPGATGLVVAPTFGEYGAAIEAAGARVVEFHAPAEEGFRLDVARLIRVIHDVRPALVFVCNPNNPTGVLVPRAVIESATQAARAHDGAVVVDESYMDFAGATAEPVTPVPARLVLHSLTKLHAIPGLRVGLLAGSERDIQRVAALQPPWSVSAPAAAAAIQALQERVFARRSVLRVAGSRARLYDLLASQRWQVFASHANFLLVGVGSAAPFRERLLPHGFAVRDCTSFGLPGYVRIAVPHDRHLGRLEAAMEACRE